MGMVLRPCYAVSGTELGYGATPGRYWKRRGEGSRGICYAMSGTDIAYAARVCYATSGTDILGTAGICYAMSGTDVPYAASSLRACYAKSGTELAYVCYQGGGGAEA
eukprot:2562424-Rhodomonas_salina.3